MNRPLEIRNIENISLEASDDYSYMYPQLVAQFTCQYEVDCNAYIQIISSSITYTVCCSVIWMMNVTHAGIDGISITTKIPKVSAVILQQCSYLHLLSITLISGIQEIDNDFDSKEYGFGILAYESDAIEMDSLEVSYFTNGVTLYRSSNVNMTNVSAAHNHCDGIDLKYCIATNMMNVSAVHNRVYGVHLFHSTDTSMLNISAAHNQKRGIHMFNCRNTNLHFTYAYDNGEGMYISGCTTTHVHQSAGNKIILVNSRDTHILKSLMGKYSKIEVVNATNTYITNTTSLITVINCVNISLKDILFFNMAVPSTASNSLDPINLPAVITLHNSSLNIRDCTFTRNNISSIKTISSKITMCGKILFHNNIAYLGTGLILAKNSFLIPTVNSNIRFQNNHAVNYGGVFYITTEESLETSQSLEDIFLQHKVGSYITSRTECFVRVGGSRSHARLTFINNTAGKGGDVLYGGLVALGYDEDWNCLLSFKNISDMSEQSHLSPISSAASRVCLCNENGQPDCLTVADPTTHIIYPGQTLTIPAAIVGQDFGTTTGSVFAQFFNNTPDTSDSVHIEQKQSILAVKQSRCSNLEYTIFSHSEEFETVLVLTLDNREISHLMNEEDNQEISNTWDILNREPNYVTLSQNIISQFFDSSGVFSNKYYESNQPGKRPIKDFYKFTFECLITTSTKCTEKLKLPKEIYGYPAYIKISFRPCPPSFSLSKDPPYRCDCNHLMKSLPGVKCHIKDQTLSRRGQIWINTDGNETVAASNCPYNYCKREEINITFEDPDSQCNFNHTGTLCGRCQPGLSLALGTNQCLHCSNSYLALLLPFALAGPVLLCFIKGLDLTISEGILNGLIFYANVVKANEHLLFEKQTNILSVFISWLNLDLGIETCFFNGLTAYWKTWLQFVFPVYIWCIAGLIIILAKYSDKVNVVKVMGDNSVPVLATLFLLSYAKLLRAVITALSFTLLSTTHGSKAVWSADGNLDYLGPEHAPLFVVAVATLLFLWLPYTLLLFLGQWLHRCNCRLIIRMMIRLKPFLDAHFGALKGNHRYWFGALLLVRALILLMSALIPVNRSIITVYIIWVCSLVLTGFAVGVYRSFTVATFNAVWFVNLGLMSATHIFITSKGGNLFLAVNCLFGVAFAQVIGLIIFKVLVIFKHSKRVMCCFHRRPPAEYALELHEQAAIQREMESDGEGKDN